MNQSRLAQQGITIIEIMIVIAIVAILVALAVPAYSDYSVRSKIAECINTSAVPKFNISEHYMSRGIYPADAETAGIVDPGAAPLSQYCQRFEYEGPGFAGSGVFSVQINPVAVGLPAGTSLLVRFHPEVDASGFVNWRCTRGASSTWAVRYLPAPCRAESVPPAT